MRAANLHQPERRRFHEAQKSGAALVYRRCLSPHSKKTSQIIFFRVFPPARRSRKGGCIPWAKKLTHALQTHLDVEIEEKDRPILAAAVASACTHLWTSDRMHFGHLYNKSIQGVRIVSSLQLLDIIEKKDY